MLIKILLVISIIVQTLATAYALRLVRATKYLSLIHISEPTRLRRISYAVFCLKKKIDCLLYKSAVFNQ